MQARYSKGLESIPVELLLETQLFALSESLPYVSRHLYHVFKGTSSIYRAQYIAYRLGHITDESRLCTRALRFPLCNRAVFEIFHRLVQARIHPPNQELLVPPLELMLKPRDKEEETPKKATTMKTTTYDLPRRLFNNLIPPSNGRPWRDNDAPLPFLHFLFEFKDGLLPDPNANSGYALTKSVHAQFMPLIQFLIDQGASPSIKDNLAVMVAIRQRNLDLVKLLIERQELTSSQPKSSKSSGKRRKLEDRVKVDARMLKVAVQCKAKDIAEYLCHEKGVIPDIQTLQLMA
ncbi:hypothetical protein FA15DRAFT_93194 [Coprinopsis marcescibilis]|uniref:Ankyrin n=1 Tax=Coprinopsis marcescibilis TaxID=230819 RepID=A0A5C3KLN2_COPMA|nr:hypothetical protein FA15DRAFT_93194 [Coprinopsis marcescibilis]